jgi:GT2 family glycosyltransferase
MNSLKASVIICTRNRAQDLIKLLCSLQQQTAAPHEIIIVDSSDDSARVEAMLKAHGLTTGFPTSCFSYYHTQPGLTYQRNIGVTLASGDALYFFDDDVELSSTYLESMNLIFAHNPQYGGGMGTITNIEPFRYTLSYIIRLIFCLQRNYSSGCFTASGMPTHPYGTANFKNVEVLGGCCMAYRSWVFSHHRFDEELRFYGYMEDCDFSRRVSRQFPLFYNPQAQLAHYTSPLNRDKIIDNRAMFIANYSYLFFKNIYPYNRPAIIVYFWSILGLFTEALLITRKRDYIKGYLKGLLFSYRHKASLPFGNKQT